MTTTTKNKTVKKLNVSIKTYQVDKTLDKDLFKALDTYLNTNETRIRFGNYFIDGNKLCYRAMVQEKKKHLDKVELQALLTAMDSGKAVACDLSRTELVETINKYDVSSYGQDIAIKVLRENVCAIKLIRNGKPLVIGNSSALELIGRRVSFGREIRNRSETDIQVELSKHVAMLPFSVFDQAKLDINTLQVIDQGGAETVTRKFETGKMLKDKETKKTYPEIKMETVHFTGASVFKVDKEYFLFDIDRQEIKHKIFNPFLVKLPVSVSSIKQAYDVLKPNDVKKAEWIGAEVKRQGEWFFIPVTNDIAKRMESLSKVKNVLKNITLRAGNNRPNDARGIELDNKGDTVANNAGFSARRNQEGTVCFVTGRVTHSGREHADLVLKGWYRAIPNTATESFTITGDID